MIDVIKEFGIRRLVHFTQAENLESIMKNGLLPNSEIQSKGIYSKSNDDYRLDFCEDATCASIQFPNYQLLYRFMMSNTNVDWVVLALRPEVLLEKECAFCFENAASNEITNIPIEERKSISAFRGMYDEYPGKPLRKTLGIPQTYPTHPQAEVLIFGEIELDYIGAVAFKGDRSKEKYAHVIPNEISVVSKPDIFGRRMDWRYW